MWGTLVELELPSAPIEVKRERPPPQPPPPPRLPTAAEIAKLDEAVARGEADAVAARRRLERAEAAMAKVLAERLEAASIGHWFDEEAWAALQLTRTELAQEWEKHRELVMALRQEQTEIELLLDDARFAA